MDYRQFRATAPRAPDGGAAATGADAPAAGWEATVPGDPFAVIAPTPAPPEPGFEQRLSDALDLLRCELDAIANPNLPDLNLSRPDVPPGTPDLGSRWATPPIMSRLYAESSALAVAHSAARRRPPGSGPRPPDLLGLGQTSIINTFVAAIRQLQQDWPTLQPTQRVAAITNAANAALASAGVPGFTPQPTVDFATMPGAAMFVSSPTEWAFVLRTDIVACADQDDRLSNVDAARIANLTLHESRHAEQAFLAARFSARQNSRGEGGKDSATISTEHQIPPTVAAQAAAQAFDPHTDVNTVRLGRLMYNAGVADRARLAQRDQAVDPAMQDLRTAWNAADQLWRKLSGPAPASPAARLAAAREADRQRSTLLKRVRQLEKRYRAYRAIPYEQDAHEIGDTAWENFRAVVWSSGEAFD